MGDCPNYALQSNDITYVDALFSLTQAALFNSFNCLSAISCSVGAVDFAVPTLSCFVLMLFLK